jgi:hypothetical protein
MKPLPLLLIASLAANAALVTVTLRHGASAAAGAPPDPALSGSSAKAGPSVRPSGEIKLPPELVQAINGNDPVVLRDFLRAAGFSDEMVRSIVQMRIWKKYEERMKALNPPPGPDQPWWKNNRADQYGRLNRQSRAQREEARRLQHEVRDEIETLLGPDPNQQRWQDQRLSFLPPEKRRDLQKIQQDYQELIGEVQQDINGFQLPSDIEKLRFLEDEQRRDIEALLSPEERLAYELRNSPSANQLRWQMTNLDATEAEYMAIFPLQKAFDEKYNPQNQYSYGRNYDSPQRDEAYWKERRAAEAALKEQIKSIIGEERFAESVRLQDNDWRQLEAATARLQLPADTPAKLYSLRSATAEAAQQVADNTALNFEQKKQALSDLAAQARTQVRTALGDEGGEAYFKNNGMSWLKELERGRVVTFNKDDPNWNTKNLPKDPKKPSAPK